MSRTHWFNQFWRYALVGLASNALLFGLYVLMTAAGVAPLLAMSLLYALGVLQTFVFNRRWSFSSRAPLPKSFVRYALSYVLGYVVNLVLLVVLHHQLGLPHQAVQAFAIVATAILLFLLQRHWVFDAAASPTPLEP